LQKSRVRPKRINLSDLRALDKEAIRVSIRLKLNTKFKSFIQGTFLLILILNIVRKNNVTIRIGALRFVLSASFPRRL